MNQRVGSGQPVRPSAIDNPRREGGWSGQVALESLPMATAILLIACPDRWGLVARTAEFVAAHHGNIVHADQHIDVPTGLFLMRLEWDLDSFAVDRDAIATAFQPVAEELQARWTLHFSDAVPRVAIFATRQEHCLSDLILRMRSQAIRAIPAVVISNHDDLRDLVEALGVRFEHVPIDSDGQGGIHERRQLELLRGHDVDLVVLAKYMRLLSSTFLAEQSEVINIHHSFLPAFAGGSPYHQAHERGVKLIGATAHYVTTELDAGPIIEQDTLRVSHRDAVPDLVRKGQDVERVVLARAVWAHVEHRVIVHGNRTSVFV